MAIVYQLSIASLIDFQLGIFTEHDGSLRSRVRFGISSWKEQKSGDINHAKAPNYARYEIV